MSCRRFKQCLTSGCFHESRMSRTSERPGVLRTSSIWMSCAPLSHPVRQIVHFLELRRRISCSDWHSVLSTRERVRSAITPTRPAHVVCTLTDAVTFQTSWIVVFSVLSADRLLCMVCVFEAGCNTRPPCSRRKSPPVPRRAAPRCRRSRSLDLSPQSHLLYARAAAAVLFLSPDVCRYC